MLAAVLVAAAVALAACGGSDEAPTGVTPSASAAAGDAGRQVLLDAQQLDVLDQPIVYPRKGPAQVSGELQVLEPGQETGWHRHRVPVLVHILEGTLTVEYEPSVVKTYPVGTTYMEAEDVWHNGTNAGDDQVRMLVVYLGAKGAKNSVERTP